jgi:predicted nucleic acid-binding protein
VTRYLLDTNILSDPLRPQPSAVLEKWMQGQAGQDLFIATLTIAELWRGVLQRTPGRRRRELEDWFASPSGPQALFSGRILSFDLSAAMEWARLMAEGSASGRPRSALDMVIAATAVANDCMVATANERHFDGVVPFINPLREIAG